jgi:hypothetical protein
MSDYVKATNFAAKDGYPVGDTRKKVKGTEIDNEFNAIASAVSTKANTNSPEFTGTPSLPTGTTGVTQAASNNSTKLATTAYVDTAVSNVDLASVWPVGSVYINASDSTNPGTLLGFGTWTAFGAGRVPVGIDSGDTDFDTAEETGGAKTHTLTVDEIPAHTHSVPNSGSQNNSFDSGTTVGNDVTGTSGSTGGGQAHNNLQPYIVVYMWKRTA